MLKLSNRIKNDSIDATEMNSFKDVSSSNHLNEGGDDDFEAIEGNDMAKQAPRMTADDEENGMSTDPVDKFLNTIPPDWEAARAHGNANLVLRNTSI